MYSNKTFLRCLTSFTNITDLFSLDERKTINTEQVLAFPAKIAVEWLDVFNVLSHWLIFPMDSELAWKINLFEVLVMY